MDIFHSNGVNVTVYVVRSKTYPHLVVLLWEHQLYWNELARGTPHH